MTKTWSFPLKVSLVKVYKFAAFRELFTFTKEYITKNFEFLWSVCENRLPPSLWIHDVNWSPITRLEDTQDVLLTSYVPSNYIMCARGEGFMDWLTVAGKSLKWVCFRKDYGPQRYTKFTDFSLWKLLGLNQIYRGVFRAQINI